jgi:hypothetical protein
MPALSVEDKTRITRAFELAYLIIPDRGIALRVAHDAWCLLDLVLGKQERSRKTYKHPRGYIKWEERSRPLRTKIRLGEEQMLQWLVYAQCDSWERATEYGSSALSPKMEDMVVRYIKHLVRITLNRNSFYVTLGLTRLLYEYGPHEVRMMYDVLTMSDSARMKDIKYLRKQKANLMDEELMRFDGMLQMVTTAYREKRFVTQPTTDRLIRLVNECLKRFTPWNTDCAVPKSFDPTVISGLYFSETKTEDEDQIEMNRIHTILHPECFARFVTGLSEFVHRLPPDSPDKSCNYDSPDKRLAVPEFHSVGDQDPLDDRFNPPKLGPDDYVRLQRDQEALGRRRRAVSPRALFVYVDDVELASFDPRRTPRIQLKVEAVGGVVEVRSKDAHGTLTLAAMIMCCDDIPAGELFRDSVVLEAGQKLTIQLQTIRDANGDVERADIEVSYAETSFVRALSLLIQRAWLRIADNAKLHDERGEVVGADYWWIGKAGLVAVLLIAAAVFVWLQLRHQPHQPPSPVVEVPQVPGPETSPSTKPEQPTPGPKTPEQPARMIARLSWSRAAKDADEAIRLEATRGEATTVQLSPRKQNLSIALPQSDAARQIFTHYRATLLAADKQVWQQTLRAPAGDLTSPAHVLNLVFAQPRIEGELLVLQFEAKTSHGWKSIGQISLRFVSR